MRDIRKSVQASLLSVALVLAEDPVGDKAVKMALDINRSRGKKSSRAQLDQWRNMGLLEMQPDGIAEYHIHRKDTSSTPFEPVLFVHGREGNAGQYATMAEAIHERSGHAVLLFDFGSHGLSIGHDSDGNASHFNNQSTYPLLLEELKNVVHRNYSSGSGSGSPHQCPHVPALVVHSAGSVAVRMALHRQYFTVGALVIIAPVPGSLREQQQHFINKLLAMPSMLTSFQRAFERRFPGQMEEWDESAMGGLPSEACATSVLLLHGIDDSAAPMAMSSARWAAAANASADGAIESKTGVNENCGRVRLVALDGAGHNSILDDARAVDAAAAFLINCAHAQPQPSAGA